MILENCPKCGDKLNFLQSSGRLICSSCKWINQDQTKKETENNSVIKQKDEEKHSNNNSFSSVRVIDKDQKFIKIFFRNKSVNTTGKILFVVGFVTMLLGLGYDTTVCSDRAEYIDYCFDRTHNIGKLNTRSNIVNVGGFLCVAGCVLFSKLQD
ncbi:hypothetical protein H1P_3940005 [Hyella patelloides LEGE 07179]|uniref:Uncharacterized protein n=1 Tax=Hyella patelloides LEGE 07179 TaxID=945734 RepID=A0A563VX74_9CYAN|nr:hypothetical protein [Hyella patelloides]VEP15987.1 hypothetical protein H1P_3940005 [Hyella patelloides LEGE 07179]